jgi:hypothetical protein
VLTTTALLEIRSRLQELTANFWLDAELLRYLNEGQKRFASEERWPWLQTVVTNGSLTTPWTDFALPENFDPTSALNLAVYFSGDSRPRRVERVTPAEGFERLTRDYLARSEPDSYFVASAVDADSDGEYIYTVTFVPALNRNATIKYLYHRIPAVLTNGGGEALDCPEEFAMGPVAYATGLAWSKELQDSRKAEEQFGLYAQIVDAAKRKLKKFPQDSQASWGSAGPDRLYNPDYVLSYRSIESAGGLG